MTPDTRLERAAHAVKNLRLRFHRTRMTKDVMVDPVDLATVMEFVEQQAAPDASAVREALVLASAELMCIADLANNAVQKIDRQALTPSEPAGREELREKVARFVQGGDGWEYDGDRINDESLAAADAILALFQNTGRG